MSTKAAREVASAFVHARSYFLAAQHSDRSIKPLLLYYGVLNLSNGFVLLMQPKPVLSALPVGHGLTTVDWQQVLAADNPDFGTLSLSVTGKGAFTNLLQSTDGFSLLRFGSSNVSHALKYDDVEPGTTFSLYDLLARIPELHDHLWRWGKETRCVLPKITSSESETTTIEIIRSATPLLSIEAAKAIFDGTEYQLREERDDAFVFAGPNSVTAMPGFTDRIGIDSLGLGDLWLAAKYPGNFQLPKICSLFATSYALGMLVRYYPAQWTGLLRSHFADEALPTLDATITHIENTYPQMVADFLETKAEDVKIMAVGQA